MGGLLVHRQGRAAGFTLVELLLVMGLMGVLLALTTIALVRPQSSASITSTVSGLVADLKAQQLKAMVGDSGTVATAQPHGVRIESAQYTLFKGSSYSGADAENFVVAVPDGVTLSFAPANIIFVKGTGEVTGFPLASDTITITSAVSGESKQIVFNRYGALTVN
jgi:prepilin-type N-terminal cleavage/methylation domain-containing protein